MDIRIRQIIVLLIIASLFAVTACASPTSSPTPTQKTPTPTPKVIEKDIEIPNSSLIYYWLPFYLKAGDRVEGEVSIVYMPPGTEGNKLYGEVRDPYGNILVETSHIVVKLGGQAVDDFPRVNPWRFAFIASTDGEHKLGVSFPTGVVNPPAASVAHLKITRYDGELSPTRQFK